MLHHHYYDQNLVLVHNLLTGLINCLSALVLRIAHITCLHSEVTQLRVWQHCLCFVFLVGMLGHCSVLFHYM